jgi:hypothetical protein
MMQSAHTLPPGCDGTHCLRHISWLPVAGVNVSRDLGAQACSNTNAGLELAFGVRWDLLGAGCCWYVRHTPPALLPSMSLCRSLLQSQTLVVQPTNDTCWC